MTPEQHEAQKAAELVAAGAPHNLTPAEVEAARATGMDLAKFAAVRALPTRFGARSVADVSAAVREAVQ